ncbi:MAG: hypothetical protein JXA09_12645 [Anaerolineae bacterium]|nr:hypothetical protein [Anaerolineae bacterium]
MGSRTMRQGWIWGTLLILLGVVLLIEAFTDLTAWAWVAILGVAGLVACGAFLTDRRDWGLLIPAYVAWAIAGLIALITLDVLRDETIATYVLAAVALPFVVGFLRDRQRWGLLIPAYIIAAVALMVGLIGAELLDDLLIPAYVLFAVSLPFFVVFARNSKQWWALIPGGITAVIAISFLIAENAAQYIAAVALLVVGGWIIVRQLLRKEPSGAESDEPPAE